MSATLSVLRYKMYPLVSKNTQVKLIVTLNLPGGVIDSVILFVYSISVSAASCPV